MKKISVLLIVLCAMLWSENSSAQNAITFWKDGISTVIDNPDSISFKDSSNPQKTGNAATYWKDGQATVVNAPDSIFLYNFEKFYKEYEPESIAEPTENEQFVVQLTSDEDAAPITSYSDEDSLIYDALAQEVIDILSLEESQPYEMPRKMGKDEDAKGKKIVYNSGQNIFSDLKIEQQKWDCKDWGKTHYARHDEFKVGFNTIYENGKRMLLVVFFHKGGFPSFYKAYVKVGQLNNGKIAGSQNVYCGNDRAIVKICIDDFINSYGCVNLFPLIINQDSKARYYLNPIFIKADPIVAGDWNQKYFGYEFGKIDGVSAYYNKDSSAGRNQSVATSATYQCVELCARYLTRQFGCVRPSGGWGNANQWPDKRRKEINDKGVNKYIVFSNDGSEQVREGDVIVWTKGTYGHVAMVVKTTPNYISIAHQNGGAKATPIGTTLSIVNGIVKDLKYDISNDRPTDKVSVLGWPITYFIRINSENENPVSFTKSMRINTTNITFPDTDINGDERSETFTIQNTSPNGTLVINSFALSNNEVFSTDIAPCSIAPGKKQTFHVTFAPKRPGVFKGSLVIRSNADDNPSWAINLTGKGIGEIQYSTINVIPKSIEFGTVKKGVPDTKLFAVQNTGSYDLKFRVDQPATPFHIPEAGQVITLHKGEHHTMEVICTGLEPGEVAENVFVKIASDATNKDEVTGITLSANGDVVPLILSSTTLTLTVGRQGVVEITSGSGIYAIESIEPSGVVNANIRGNTVSIEALKAGSTKITIKDTKSGLKASIEVTVWANLSLSVDGNINLKVGESTAIDITSGSGYYSIEKIVPTGVVTASISGNRVSIDAKAEGTAKITVNDGKSGQKATIEVTVKGYVGPVSYLACPDDNHPHMIDLGLPSGTKWACCNVDTDHPENQSPTNYGGNYAWGETKTKKTYSWNSYIHCDGVKNTCHNLGNDISGTQYDVAHVKWGDGWQMPTYDQMMELINNCTYEYTKMDGIRGSKFTGSNGASIFLPAAGSYFDNDHYNFNIVGFYWTSTQPMPCSDATYGFYFSSDSPGYLNYTLNHGFSIRPIRKM